MKHGNSIRKFNRNKNQRKALIESLARSLVLKEKIKTTQAKAKSLRPYVEKLVTKGKNGTLVSKRILISKIGKEGANKIVDVLSPRFKDRKGGYTRIVKLPNRLSDGSPMAVIEFTE